MAGASEDAAEFEPADLDLALDAVEQQALSAPARTLLGDLYATSDCTTKRSAF